MGACVSIKQKNKLAVNQASRLQENKENIIGLQIERKTQDTTPKLIRSVQTLKAKMPKKRIRQGTEVHAPELNYTIDHNDNPIEFKIKIRKSQESMPMAINQLSQDEIPQPINEQQNICDIYGGSIQPININVNEVLQHVLEMSIFGLKRDTDKQTTSSSVMLGLRRENSMQN